MNAQPITNGELDSIIYTPALKLLPARCPLPTRKPPTRVNRKTAGANGVIVSFGGVSVVVENDDDMARAFEQLMREPLPMKALEPVPEPYVLTTPVLPIDEKPIPVACPPILNHTEAAKSLSIPKLTRKPVRLPVGQRVLAPINCWYSVGSAEFWYRFEVMPGFVVGYSETDLIAANEGSVRV